MRSLLAILLSLSTVCNVIPAVDSLGVADDAEDYRFYIGMNPVAIPVSLPLKDDLKRYLPVASGLEYGISITGGYYPKCNSALEARLSFGNIHKVALTWQLHTGGNYFMFRTSDIVSSGLYVGGFIKFWDYYNKLSEVHFMNIAPYLTAGYLLEFKRLLMDLRLNQTVAVLSWSTLEHTSPGADWFLSPWPSYLPVIPTFTFTLGFRL